MRLLLAGWPVRMARRSVTRAARPEFAVGERVVVKPTAADPDLPDMPLGAWSGMIEKVWRSTPVRNDVRPDRRTLHGMHRIYRWGKAARMPRWRSAKRRSAK